MAALELVECKKQKALVSFPDKIGALALQSPLTTIAFVFSSLVQRDEDEHPRTRIDHQGRGNN